MLTVTRQGDRRRRLPPSQYALAARTASIAFMSFSAFALDFAKSPIDLLLQNRTPLRSHNIAARAPVSISSSCAGPHVIFSPTARLRPWTLRNTATHSFHTQRHRAHPASSRQGTVEDTRSQNVYRARPATLSATAAVIMTQNPTAPTDNERERRSEQLRRELRRSAAPPQGPMPPP